MSKKITRPAIARDALAALDAKKLVATTGSYVGYVWSGEASGPRYGTDIRDFLLAPHKPVEPCKTCALGAIFCGLTRTIGSAKFGQPGSVWSPLIEYFSDEQLHLIERCFEGWYEDGRAYRTRILKGFRPTAKEKAEIGYLGTYVFDEVPRANDKVLRAILKNIIDGRGAFNPSR